MNLDRDTHSVEVFVFGPKLEMIHGNPQVNLLRPAEVYSAGEGSVSRDFALRLLVDSGIHTFRNSR